MYKSYSCTYLPVSYFKIEVYHESGSSFMYHIMTSYLALFYGQTTHESVLLYMTDTSLSVVAASGLLRQCRIDFDMSLSNCSLSSHLKCIYIILNIT